MAPFCSRCGTQQSDEAARFCSNCGHPLAAGSAPQQQEDPSEEEEKVIWEGKPKRHMNINTYSEWASLSSRYRLTNRMLYVKEGVLTTTSRQVPLWAVREANTKQAFEQKMNNFFSRWTEENPDPEGTADIIVYVEHPDYTGDDETVTLKNVEGYAEVQRLINEKARVERVAHERRRSSRYFGQAD